MAKVKWVEDYGQYKKGDEFRLSGDALNYLLKTGKIEIVEENDRKADMEAEPDPKQKEDTETAAMAEAETATQKTAKKSGK